LGNAKLTEKTMPTILTPQQCRVIGVMLEKETTTPEHYPLSLNSLTNACNQKSNREPVMSLSESQVQDIVDELAEMNLVSDQGAFGGRVAKYHHRFCNTEFGNLQFTKQQAAIICVMFLRGPQTPGELRTRTNRLADFANVSEVETTLSTLQNFADDPLVIKLPREAGKRDSRYAHTFCGAEQPVVNDMPELVSENGSELSQRVAQLEKRLDQLTTQMADLLDQLS
jgi:uncharacterized protein YceH (UPF0502 family)